MCQVGSKAFFTFISKKGLNKPYYYFLEKIIINKPMKHRIYLTYKHYVVSH